MNNTFRFPLSGSVTQAINPWELWIKTLSTQTGFINIYNTTNNPELEKRITTEVAGYGKQLGKINDVLSILLESVDQQALPEEQRREVQSFQAMVAGIERIKREQPALTDEGVMAQVDDLIGVLQQAKQQQPQVYEAAVAKLRAAL